MYTNWAREVLQILGVRIAWRCNSDGLPTSGLLVANHTSWLDTLVLRATAPCGFVSKSELEAWPFIGSFIRHTGGLFIRRESLRDITADYSEIRKALRAGALLTCFPEAATGDGTTLRRFTSAIFQCAIDTQSAVTAVALQYLRNGHAAREAVWVEGQGFWKSIMQVIDSGPGLVATLEVAHRVDHADDRKTVAIAAQRAIAERLGLPCPSKRTATKTDDAMSESEAYLHKCLSEILVHIGVLAPSSIFDPDASLEELAIDSLTAIPMCMLLEERMGIALSNDALRDFGGATTIRDLVRGLAQQSLSAHASTRREFTTYSAAQGLDPAS